MDPLSAAASVAGLIILVEPVVQYALSVKHEKKELQAFAERFQRIVENLESLKARLRYIEEHFQQEHELFGRARLMNQPGNDIHRLRKKLEPFRDKFDRKSRSDFQNLASRATWKWKKDDYKEEQENILIDIKLMRDKINDDDMQVVYKTFSYSKNVSQKADATQIHDILEWICPEAMDLVPLTPYDTRNTSLSFTESSLYERWYEDADWQLNCYGEPGCGKTFRSQSVVKDLKRKLSSSGVPVLSTFFHHKFASRQSLQTVLRSLLRQLLSSRQHVRIPAKVEAWWKRYSDSGRDEFVADEAREVLLEELANFPKKYWIVDAVDEAEGDGHLTSGHSIDSEIHNLRNQGVCIFSTERLDRRELSRQIICDRCSDRPLIVHWRCGKCVGTLQTSYDVCQSCYQDKGLRCHDPTHVMSLQKKVNAEMRASDKEIEAYVTRFLNQEFKEGDSGDDDSMFGGRSTPLAALKPYMEPAFWTSLPNKVAVAAGGNFLYAHMFMERLRLQQHADGALSLEQQLGRSTLDKLGEQFGDMLRLCLDADVADDITVTVARDHMSLVAARFDVLTFQQVTHAAAISRKDKAVKDFRRRLCRKDTLRKATNGLLSLTDSGKAESFPVAFFHRSLEIYVHDHRSTLFPDSDQRIFTACMAYLSLDAFSTRFKDYRTLQQTLKEYPFATYAACYWGHHARAVPATAANTISILELLSDRARMSCVMQIAWSTRAQQKDAWDVSDGVTPLHVTAFYGLKDLTTALITCNSHIDDEEDTYHQTPLIYACRNGHVDIVASLLEAGANANHLSTLKRSPLLEAIDNGHENILDVLLRRDAVDVNVRAVGRDATTALVRAAELGRSSMLQKLLKFQQDDLDVNRTDGDGYTALCRAVQRRRPDCVELLLAHPATDLTVKDLVGKREALDWTADNSIQHDEDSADICHIAGLLLQDKRKPRVSIGAVTVAIEGSKLELLKLFIAAGLEHAYTDMHGRTFLHLAATVGDYAVTQLLYGYAARLSAFDLNQVDHYGASTLHMACRGASDKTLDTIAFLLKQGVDPEIVDNEGFTAARRARSRSTDFWDSDVKALFGPYLDQASLDDSRDIAPTIVSFIQSSDLDALKTYLGTSTDPLSPEIDHYTLCSILHLTVEAELSDDRKEEFLSLLLPRFKQCLNAVTSDGRTCAHLAVAHSALPCLKTLVEQGSIDLNIEDRWGMTALELAQRMARYEMFVYLAAKGARLPPSEDIRPGVIHEAVCRGELEALKRLVDVGVDPHYRDPIDGLTTLQRAEELLEDATGVQKDRLLQETFSGSVEAFAKAVKDAPEVVKRQAVVDFLQEALGRAVGPRLQPHTWPDLSDLMSQVRGLTPEQPLADMNPKSQDTMVGTSSPSRSMEAAKQSSPLEDASFSDVQLRMLQECIRSGSSSGKSFDVGSGVVIIVVSVCVAAVCIVRDIVWLLAERQEQAMRQERSGVYAVTWS